MSRCFSLCYLIILEYREYYIMWFLFQLQSLYFNKRCNFVSNTPTIYMYDSVIKYSLSRNNNYYEGIQKLTTLNLINFNLLFEKQL